MRPGLPGHQPTGRAPKEGSACSLTHGSAHSSLSPPGRARAQLQGMGLPDAWPGRWRSQVGMRPVARRCASRARLGPALRQHWLPHRCQAGGTRAKPFTALCWGCRLGPATEVPGRRRARVGARRRQGPGWAMAVSRLPVPLVLPSGLDGREGVLSGPSRLAVGTEGQGSKMPLPPPGALLGMPHTCSPFGPEEPCGPGRPRSPFSPCSPGGPMSPIRPG